jgi:hypothetical protein
MSKTKVLIALLGMHLAGAVLAQTTPLTVQEWTLQESEIKRAEWANKLREERQKGNPDKANAPVVADRTCDDDLQMSAVYGMGRNLRADFIYRGATVTLQPGGDADMGGWSVRELSATRAVMVKRTKSRNGGVNVKTCPLYLSAGARDFTAPVTPLVNSGEVQEQVPPIRPITAPAAGSGQKNEAAAGGAK